MINQNRYYSKTYYLIILALGFLIGLLFAAHFKSKSLRLDNINYSNEELQKIFISLEKEQNDLKLAINQQEKELVNYQNELQKEEKISYDDLKILNSLKKSAGLISETGEGIIIILDDGKSNSKASIDNFLVHASDLRDLINFLWLTEACCCSINQERIIFTTSIDCVGNTIMVNNNKIGPPYKIAAIVNQEKFRKLWENDNYLKDFKNRLKKGYLDLKIDYLKEVQVPAYSGGLNF